MRHTWPGSGSMRVRLKHAFFGFLLLGGVATGELCVGRREVEVLFVGCPYGYY